MQALYRYHRRHAGRADTVHERAIYRQLTAVGIGDGGGIVTRFQTGQRITRRAVAPGHGVAARPASERQLDAARRSTARRRGTCRGAQVVRPQYLKSIAQHQTAVAVVERHVVLAGAERAVLHQYLITVIKLIARRRNESRVRVEIECQLAVGRARAIQTHVLEAESAAAVGRLGHRKNQRIRTGTPARGHGVVARW